MLLPEDKQLIELGNCLNDQIISSWLLLLRNKYSSIGGLHHTVAVTNKRFKRRDHQHGIVQVLNCSNRHWVTFSSVGCAEGVVLWMDSMHGGPSRSQEVTIADLLECSKERINIKICNVQLQVGGSDCGLFSLAFATAAIQGLDPTSIKFDQSGMRNHLLRCLKEKDPKLFPTEVMSVNREPKYLMSYNVQIYCMCRLPDDGNMMVCCVKCLKWYHQACTDVASVSEKKVKKLNWVCAICDTV